MKDSERPIVSQRLAELRKFVGGVWVFNQRTFTFDHVLNGKVFSSVSYEILANMEVDRHLVYEGLRRGGW